MRSGHTSVTHNVTRESQPPVPSRPYPARPALYIAGGDFSIHLTFRTARAATARSDITQPARVRTGWMAAPRINGGHR